MAIFFRGQFMGQSDSKHSGLAGSFAESVGIDGISVPGSITVHQKMKKDSGATVTEFVKVAIAASNGYSFWFSADSGKIWARTSAGVWTLAHTTTPAAGEAKCLGASEFNGYVYWATQSRLHRIAIADADNTWANVVEDWQTFGVTDDKWHPMAQQDLTLFIGDGNQIASVDDSGTFDANALDIKTPLRIKTMTPFELDLLIGTYVADTVNKTEIIRWDTVSTSWNTSDTIEEVGINAFIRDDNYLYVNAGKAGNLYFYNGEQLILFKKIPGTYSSAKYGTVHPNSVGNFQGRPIFGASNGAGNPFKQGIYELSSYSRDYPKVLSLGWVNSQNKTASQEIGAVLVLGGDILSAFRDTSSYGIDILDASNKYTGAYLETMMLAQKSRDEMKTLQEVQAFYSSLPANTGITIYYKKNHGSYIEMTEIDDEKRMALIAKLSVSEIGSLQLKFLFTVSGNNAPTLSGLGAIIN